MIYLAPRFAQVRKLFSEMCGASTLRFVLFSKEKTDPPFVVVFGFYTWTGAVSEFVGLVLNDSKKKNKLNCSIINTKSCDSKI